MLVSFFKVSALVTTGFSCGTLVHSAMVAGNNIYYILEICLVNRSYMFSLGEESKKRERKSTVLGGKKTA